MSNEASGPMNINVPAASYNGEAADERHVEGAIFEIWPLLRLAVKLTALS